MKIFTSDTVTLTKTSHQLSLTWQKNHRRNGLILNDNYLLLQVLDNLEIGVLIISLTGEVLHANTHAEQICMKINSHKQNSLPSIIWYLCESMVNINQQLSSENMMITDEFQINHQDILRVCVKLITLENYPHPGFLVTVENRSEAVKNIAIAEVKQFALTPREAEIWHLYRTNHTYKNIASRLYITVNTVKKHMKNIHAKRQAFMTRHQC